MSGRDLHAHGLKTEANGVVYATLIEAIESTIEYSGSAEEVNAQIEKDWDRVRRELAVFDPVRYKGVTFRLVD